MVHANQVISMKVIQVADVDLVIVDRIKGWINMNLAEIKNKYIESSAKVSDYTRNIDYSIIALVWIFSNEDISKAMNFKWVLMLALGSLVVDFVQYLLKTLCVWIAYKKLYKEKGGDEDAEVLYPSYIQYITWTCWFAKIIAMVVSLVLLLFNVLQQ